MSPNELDNFLRQKEREFDVPFEEKYWEQARELIDRERGFRRVAWWQNANLRVAALVLLLGGIAGWYALTNNLINEAPVATTNGRVEATPYFENNDNTSAAGSGNSVSSDLNAVENSTTTSTASTSAAAVSDNVSQSDVKRPRQGGETGSKSSGVATNVFTLNLEEKRVGGLASADVNSNSVKSVSSVDNKNVASKVIGTASSSNRVKSSNKTTIASQQNLSIASNNITSIRALKPFIYYRIDNEIPVFEEMTPNDPTLLKFYGLYYKSEGAASRKIRDFKRGAQYPQLGFAAAGGINVFNQIRHSGDTNVYLGVNPYVGFKACYQWNPMMMVSVQPMLVQRGGIHIHPAMDSASSTVTPATVTSTRHLYYLQIPATLGFKVSKKNTLFGGGGVSVLLANGYNTLNSETEKIEGKYKIGESESFNKIDYFVTLGYQFRMNKNISIQAAINYGFTDITKNTVANAQRHNNLQASLGVTYQLYQDKLNLRR